uniref:NADH-ubiquinone oxidoreductase chain 4L n=1 Tax=Enithares tibialis TaxID=575841 RepID=C5HIU8_9HEMI|nr:NADH dehydrogenase subunit 4L [Enithares tibialis]ACJ69543.1 NADH dehydrogenase subunit 4L [Enithares tibialis]
MFDYSNILFYFLIIMFILGLFVFSSMHKHLLMTLLSLEFLVLVLFLSFFSFLTMYSHENYFILIFLTFSVCEGAFGLGILVSMIRSHGNDYVSSLSSLVW